MTRCFVDITARELAAAFLLFVAALTSHAADRTPTPLRPAASIDPLVEIGMHLFSDERLSVTRKVSCATCHKPQNAFADGLPTAIGAYGLSGTRNTPTLWDSGSLPSIFWDGRRATLEDQAIDPLLNSREHGLSSEQDVLTVVRSAREYQEGFRTVFGVSQSDISVQHITKALAAFQRTLVSDESSFDRYHAGDKDALSASALRGFGLFHGRAACTSCHTLEGARASLTDHKFHAVGVDLTKLLPRLAELSERVVNVAPAMLDGMISGEAEVAALGRFVVTRDPRDIGRFRTPSLRNVAVTAPYMHDGSVATLEDAIDSEVYYRSLKTNRPLALTPAEKADLVAFLQSLTSANALDHALARK